MTEERLKVLLSNALGMLEESLDGDMEYLMDELGITEEEYNEIMDNN